MSKKQTDNAIGFSLLNGRDYILKANWVSQAPEIQFPADSLDDGVKEKITVTPTLLSYITCLLSTLTL